MSSLILNKSHWALIPASGQGERFGSQRPKQHHIIHGKSLLEHSIDKMLAMPFIDQVLVALASDDEYSSVLADRYVNKRVRWTIGGEKRSDTVLRLLDLVNTDSVWVWVHDAVRPLVSPDDLMKLYEVVEAFSQEGKSQTGAILATPVADTVKLCHDQWIETQLVREKLMLALTPQVFNAFELKQAFDCANQVNFNMTDEAGVFKAWGGEVLTVQGSRMNIKLTYPEDWVLFECLLGTNI